LLLPLQKPGTVALIGGRIPERALPVLVSQAILAEQHKKEGRDHDIQPTSVSMRTISRLIAIA